MSLCEKVKVYEKEVREQLEIEGYARILNLQYSKDTGQFNVQLQETLESGKKQKHGLRAVVLPEEVSNEITELLLSKVYPHFEAKQVELTYHKEWSLMQEPIKKEIEESFTLQSQPIVAEANEEIKSVQTEHGFEVQKALSKDSDTLEDYKNNLEEADKLRANMTKETEKFTSARDKALEVLKEEITEELHGKKEKAFLAKVAKVKEDYGISL